MSLPMSNHEIFFKTLERVIRLKPNLQEFLDGIKPAKEGLLVKTEAESSVIGTKTSAANIDEDSALNFFVWLTTRKISDDLESLYNQIDPTASAPQQLTELWTNLQTKYNRSGMRERDAPRRVKRREMTIYNNNKRTEHER